VIKRLRGVRVAQAPRLTPAHQGSIHSCVA
jgi:hypothetical protein